MKRWKENRSVGAEANKKTAARTQKQKLEQLNELYQEAPDATEVIHNFEDGWSIRRPTTLGDVHRAGELMSNCMSANFDDMDTFCDNYADGFEFEGELDLNLPADPSLRLLVDADGIPHAAWYEFGGGLENVLGSHNSYPKQEYINYLIQYYGADQKVDATVTENDDIFEINPTLNQMTNAEDFSSLRQSNQWIEKDESTVPFPSETCPKCKALGWGFIWNDRYSGEPQYEFYCAECGYNLVFSKDDGLSENSYPYAGTELVKTILGWAEFSKEPVLPHFAESKTSDKDLSKESDWSDHYRWAEDGLTRLPAEEPTCASCGLKMKKIELSGFPYYHCGGCGLSKKANAWLDQGPVEGQQEVGCGICGLTLSELSTVDSLSGNSNIDSKALALPCEICEGNYYESEMCGECNGEGNHRCEYCGGSGTYECHECHGQGDKECPYCLGSEEDEDGELCSDCHGGKIDCEICAGDGENDCPECSGNGLNECEYCEGYGAYDCSHCSISPGIGDYVGLEEWCEYWENNSAQAGTPVSASLYPWPDDFRYDVIWSDECLAFNNYPQDSLGLEVHKVGTNKKVWAYKKANAWKDKSDPNQMRLVGCPYCGSDDLYPIFETGNDIAPIEIHCQDCNEYFPYQDYESYNGEKVLGQPMLVEDTLSQPVVKDGPETSDDYEGYIEGLVFGRDDEYFKEAVADELYEWARMTNTLPELNQAADNMADTTSGEVTDWTYESLAYDQDYISPDRIEEMNDEEFTNIFEGQTREEAVEAANDAWDWYYNENARNYGLYQAVQHILDYFRTT